MKSENKFSDRVLWLTFRFAKGFAPQTTHNYPRKEAFAPQKLWL